MKLTNFPDLANALKAGLLPLSEDERRQLSRIAQIVALAQSRITALTTSGPGNEPQPTDNGAEPQAGYPISDRVPLCDSAGAKKAVFDYTQNLLPNIDLTFLSLESSKGIGTPMGRICKYSYSLGTGEKLVMDAVVTLQGNKPFYLIEVDKGD